MYALCNMMLAHTSTEVINPRDPKPVEVYAILN